MPYTNEFLPVATGIGANVEDQVDFVGSAVQLAGFLDGPVDAPTANKIWRQSSTWAAVLGQVICDYAAANADDDGNVAEIEANFATAIEGIVAPFVVHYGTDTGTQNNLTVNTSPAVTVTPTAGMPFAIRAAFTNSSTSPVITVNGFGPYTLVMPSGGPLQVGQIDPNGYNFMIYDGSNMELLTGSQTLEVPSGVIQLASGSSAIAVEDIVAIGGPGNRAYPVQTSNYAASGIASTFLLETSEGGSGSITPTGSRQATITDPQGNIFYLTTPLVGSNILTAYKLNPVGLALGSVTIDAYTSGQAWGPMIVQLSNNSFAAVWSRTNGALYYAVFDTSLTIIQSATLIDNIYNSTNVTYFDVVAKAAGGFAIAYQATGATHINLTTYNNLGVQVLAPASVQTLTSTLALCFVRMLQLSNGNLMIAMRTTMSPSGTSFVIVNSVTGASVVGNTVMDNTSTAGFTVASMLTGYFAIGEMNGTYAECAVYSNGGALQGGKYTFTDTLNSQTYIHLSLENDTGTNFWFTFMDQGGTAGFHVAQIPVTGTGFQTGSFTGTVGSGFALATKLICGQVACLFASSSTSGQYWATVGLPDAGIGVVAPYIRNALTSFGSAASVNGSYWPKVLDGGDWTMVMLYDHQTNGHSYLGIQKFEQSAIIGTAISSMNAGLPGSPVQVAAGNATFPANTIKGTDGIQFNHASLVPFGNSGVLFTNGLAAYGINPANQATLQQLILKQVFGTGYYQVYYSNTTFTVPIGVSTIRVRVVGGGGGGGAPASAGTAGGTTSFGSYISATGGTGGSGTTGGTGGTGAGGIWNVSGGVGGSSVNAGGGAAGSSIGNGGVGGTSDNNTHGGGGGGGVGSNNGGSVTYAGSGGNAPGAGGGGSSGPGGGLTGPSGGAAVGGVGGADSAGGNAAPGAAGASSPTGITVRFPFDQLPGGGGGGATSGNGGAGGPGGGGGGAYNASASANGGPGGVGGGGGGAGTSATPGTAGAGGYGAGGGGAAAAGGAGGGYSITILPVTPGLQFVVTVGAAGAGHTASGATSGNGGAGLCVVEW